MMFSENFKSLFIDTFENCIKHGFSIHFENSESVDGCGGYVDEESKVFAVALKNNLFPEILVHESCHLDQSIEQSPIYMDSDINDYNIFSDEVWTAPNPSLVFYKTMMMEDDCDRRAIEKIKDYDLSEIDIPAYIQQANVYHASYYYFWKYKCFYHPDHNPYKTKSLLNLFPDDVILPPSMKWQENKKLGDFIKKYHVSL